MNISKELYTTKNDLIRSFHSNFCISLQQMFSTSVGTLSQLPHILQNKLQNIYD